MHELPAQCPDIALAVPVVRGGAQIVYENNNWATMIYSTTPGFLLVRELSVAEGAEFSPQDVDSANKVALLGQTVVTNLFGDVDPVGQSIRIKNVPFTVVGVLDRKGQSPTGQDQDDVILLPISTAKRKVVGIKSANADAVDSIVMEAKGGNQIEAAQDEAKALLRQRHHLAPSEDDDFSIRNMEEIFAAQEASSHIMSIMLAAVASVSLIVGGIGIMNIMLVSVRERTREIGLRQAVGAKTRDILTQFLAEAVALSIAGGCIESSWGSPRPLSFRAWRAGTRSSAWARSRWRFYSPLWWGSALGITLPGKLLIWTPSKLCVRSRWVSKIHSGVPRQSLLARVHVFGFLHESAGKELPRITAFSHIVM